MKKILIPVIAAAAFAVPPSAPVATAAPLCQANEPASVGVRCYGSGRMCQVWVYVAETDDAPARRVCI